MSNTEEEDEGPAGDLFGFGHRPGRRIVRARRPPQSRGGAPDAGSSDLSGAGLNGRSPSAGGDRPPLQNGGVADNAGARGNRDDDDEEDDDSLEDYMPHLEDITAGIAMSQSGFPPVDDDDDDEEDNDFDMSPPHLLQFLEHMARSSSRRTNSKLSSQIRPVDDDQCDFDIAEDYEPRCSACYRRDDPAHPWRRLVTLPCCGTNGREEKSSTRFSAGCLLKLAVTKSCSSENNEYTNYETEPDTFPVKRFYEKDIQNDSRRFFECPRCRSVLLIKIKGLKPDEDDDDSDCECMCDECVSERNRKAALRADKKT